MVFRGPYATRRPNLEKVPYGGPWLTQPDVFSTQVAWPRPLLDGRDGRVAPIYDASNRLRKKPTSRSAPFGRGSVSCCEHGVPILSRNQKSGVLSFSATC